LKEVQNAAIKEDIYHPAKPETNQEFDYKVIQDERVLKFNMAKNSTD
jgi:hypothetical protein